MLKGKTVKCVREMTPAELAAEGWDSLSPHDNPLVIEFGDGAKVFASADMDGNGPGALVGVGADGVSFYVMPEG